MQKNLSAQEILLKLKTTLCEEAQEGPVIPPYASIKIPDSLPENKGFSCYKDVLFQTLDKALLLKYKNISINTSQKLVFFTWVIPSGLGDLGMQIHIAEMIAKEEPKLAIELVSIIDERSPLPKNLRSTLPHHIIKYSHPTPPDLPAEVITLMRNAFSIISIPTPYFDYPNLEKTLVRNNARPPTISRIGQYGFIDTENYNPSTGNRSMGLYPLEKGIITLDPIQPQERDNNTYFAYLITKQGVLSYLLAILITRKNDSDNLTVLIPNLGKIISFLGEINYESYGVQKVVIDDDPNYSEITAGDNGKTITFRHKKEMTPTEITEYMATSNPFVGIRGDGSFTECLATDATFFYDALDHALPFLVDLKKIAHDELLPYFSLIEYLTLLFDTHRDPKQRAIKIAECLEDPSFEIGMQKLKTILREKYSFNRSLLHLIKQNYAFYENRGRKEKEDKLLDRFIEEKITLSELLSFGNSE